MHIVLLSEHGDPLIGGATHLTKKIAESIAQLGHYVTFIVPNSNSSLNESESLNDNFHVVKIRAVVPIDDRSKFKGAYRKKFALEVDSFLKEYYLKHKVDVIQVLSGLYIMRYLDINYYKKRNIITVAGLLNIPPEECGLSWEGDKYIPFIKDQVRKYFVKRINKYRIRYNKYDAYTVSSNHVKSSLQKYVSQNLIHYMPYGAEVFPGFDSIIKQHDRINILTAWGINPSKNQHIICEIASILIKKNVSFNWDVIGPNRNNRYTQFFKDEILNRGLDKHVSLILGMPKSMLMKFYEGAHIYVQTSIEEGFCMTALDAIIYGLPLIGCNTGAISEFISKGKGILVENKPEEFAAAIIKIINQPDQYRVGLERVEPLLQFYNWNRISQSYITLYESLIARMIN